MNRRPGPDGIGARLGDLALEIEDHERELSERWTGMQGGLVRSTDEMLLFVVGEPVAFTNGVRMARLRPEDADHRIEEAAAVFRDRGVPATWWVGPASRPRDLGARLVRHGFALRDGVPWLSRALDDLSPVPPPQRIEVHRVSSSELEASWLEAMAAGFGLDRTTTDAVARLSRVVGFAEEAPWQRFVALEEGRAVCSSGLMAGERLASIHNVATAPGARGRGLATAMTALALERARALEYRAAVLGAATPAARRLYGRMGFGFECSIEEYLLESEP